MAMRSSSSPRRLYTRAGSLIVCYGGVYFGPAAKKPTALNGEKEVTIEMLDPVGGRKRIAVTQKVGHEKVTENWTEKKLTFASRTESSEA